MVSDAVDGQDEQQLGKMRGQLGEVVKQKRALEEQERVLRLEMKRAAQPPTETEPAEEAPADGGEAAGPPNFVVDRFMQGLAWLPSRVSTNLACESVARKYALLPVTLYCGHDPASREVETVLTQLFEGSCRVTFRVRHFWGQDPCGMEDVLGEQAALFCFHCPGKEGEADTIHGRDLRKKLHFAGKGWADSSAPPGACSVFGYGYKDPYVMLYRNSRGDSGLVSEALEALGSTPLLKHLFVDEEVKGGVPAAARQWASAVAQKVEDWARGAWEPEEEVLKGPEWTFEEVMRWDFVVNRRGMQDG